MQWLAQREHSRQELRTKLLLWAARRACSALDAAHAERRSAAEAGDDVEAEASSAQGLPRLELDEAELEAAVDTVLAQLVDSGLLSDERFVESRVHVRLPRFGNRRIEAELRQHGVQAPDELLSQLKASEVQRARDALRVRFGGARRSPSASGEDAAAQRARHQRFLAARGFSVDAIRQALRDVGAD